MYMSSDPKQPFLTINQVAIYPIDLTILVKLYQPLIGSVALSLYLTLNENYDAITMLSDAHGLYTLQEQLDCDLKQLWLSLHKLEGVGLIQTRLVDNQVMGKVLTFQLARVPSSSAFFSTPLLASLLKEKVGVTVFKQLSTEFAQQNKQSSKKVIGLDSAPDISASFMDVFRLPEEEAINPSSEVKQAADANQSSPVEAAQVRETDEIDWDFIKQAFETYQITGSEIVRNQSAIREVMRTYGLTEQEFIDEALPCLHGEYQLNMPLIKQTIANSIHGMKMRQQLQQKPQQPTSTKGLSPKEQQILHLAADKSPAQFLYYLKSQKQDYVDASEYQVLDRLYNQQGISAELLNVLTYTCLKSGANVSYRLANTILHDWLQHGVKDGAQAFIYMTKRQQEKEAQRKKRAQSFYPQKTVEKGTDWTKKKAQINNDYSSEELKSFFKDWEDKNGMK